MDTKKKSILLASEATIRATLKDGSQKLREMMNRGCSSRYTPDEISVHSQEMFALNKDLEEINRIKSK